MKRILFLTQWYPPEKTPRAFRAYELAQEFARRGNKIDLYAPIAGRTNRENSNIVYYAIEKHRAMSFAVSSVEENKIKHAIKQHLKKFYLYFLGDYPKDVLYSYRMLCALLKNARHIKYDMAISISLPFPITAILAVFSLVNKKIDIKIADFGDPYYYNPHIPKAIYFKWIEKIVLTQIDYITIPIYSAEVCYTPFKSKQYVKVIPQGYNMTDTVPCSYVPNAIPTFCYAGIFYETIRNPDYFFDYLLDITEEFVFIIYALQDRFTLQLLDSYKDRFGDRLVVVPPIDREALIHEMAKMDFVINFDNDNATQRPSKLIDYAMSRRPILSFNRQTFRPEVFQAFLKGDYSEQYHVDLAQYDIRRVVDQFEALVDEKIRGDVK